LIENVETGSKRIIAEQFDINPKDLTYDTRLARDLLMNSLDELELAAAFEKEFNLEIAERISEVKRNCWTGDNVYQEKGNPARNQSGIVNLIIRFPLFLQNMT